MYKMICVFFWFACLHSFIILPWSCKREFPVIVSPMCETELSGPPWILYFFVSFFSLL